MKSKGGFFQGFIVFFLVIIIFGGVGFLGYNVIFQGAGMSGMNMSQDTASNSTDSESSNMNMSMNETDQSDNTESQSDTEDTATTSDIIYKTEQATLILENRELLQKAINSFNTSLEKMTLNPYADKDQMSNQKDSDMQMNETDTGSVTNDNTTVNIYTAPVDQQVQMQSMGQSYDADKMEQLHSGIYKVTVGIQLLEQLSANMEVQSQQASLDTTAKTEFYITQYNRMVQNKTQLSEALEYVNAAVDLININPYVDENGNVYNSNNMDQLHEGLKAYAQAVVELNNLSDKLVSQTIVLGNLAQVSYNETISTDSGSMNMTSNTTGGMFGNLNATNIFTVVLIGFVVIFIIGLIGAIISLFKPNKINDENSY